MSIWLVTGASRGLGREIARQALRRGDSVAGAARRTDQVDEAFAEFGDRVLAVALDVTDESQARQAVAATLARFGRIDYLVNNAGRGLIGAVEEASAAEVESIFATNLYGTLNVIRAALPAMRSQRAGRVVNISSMGGFAQFPGWGIYGATKFALEGVSEAMAGELAPLGIHVTIVEPGGFRTDFLDGSSITTTASTIDDYADTAGRTRALSTGGNHVQVNDPVKGAAAIVDAVTSDHPPTRLPLGPDAIAVVEHKLAHVRDELEAWRSLSASTPFDADGADG